MQINLINETNQDAYLRFGTGTPTGTYNGGTLDTSTSYLISAGATLTGMSLTQFIGGRLLISLGGTLTSGNPDFQFNSSDPSAQLRWDKIEMSLFDPSDTVDVSAANLSSTDFFGLDLQLQTFQSGATVAAQTLGWTVPTQTVLQDLAAIANNDSAAAQYVVVTGTNGLNVPTLSENVLRVIAPSTSPPPGQTAYASPQAYIDSIQNAGIVTEVNGQFSRNGTSTASDTQTFDFSASIPTVATNGAQPGDLLMIGEGSLVGPNQTIIIAAANLAAGIISDNPPYTVNGAAGQIGDNDVYAAAVRDILAGFGYGLVGSNEIDPLTGVAFVNEPTSKWYAPGQSQSVAFAAAQPGNPTYYNQYAAEIAALSDSYGFPFTDLLGAPQAQLTPATISSITITILPDTSGGDVVSCFAAGTPIQTTTGEHPVETLAVGMIVPTVFGPPTKFGPQPAEIVWIGHRHVDCRRHPRPEAVWPIRIRRGAFGPDRPHRDLLLSPDHAVLVEDVLIPVRYLVNGASIVQEPMDEITYYHVELDRHDVVLAAGLAAESFLDTGNRVAFANGGPAVAAWPDFAPLRWETEACAPLVLTGPILERVRTRLRTQAGARLRGPMSDGGRDPVDPPISAQRSDGVRARAARHSAAG